MIIWFTKRVSHQAAMYWVGSSLLGWPNYISVTGVGWVRPHSCQCLDHELSVPHDGYTGHRDGRLLLCLDHSPCIFPCLQPPHHGHQFQFHQACHCRCFFGLLCSPRFPHGDCSLWLRLQHEGQLIIFFSIIGLCLWRSMLPLVVSTVYPGWPGFSCTGESLHLVGFQKRSGDYSGRMVGT